MDLYSDMLRALPPAEKLRLVECIWDDLATNDQPIPLPDWAVSEAARRRDEMLADPKLGVTDGEVWMRIAAARNG
jgi:putative addiction module component (TIGR02574 family)